MPLLKKEPDLFPGDLFAGFEPGSPWWVAHVHSRQEKVLIRHFLEHRVPFYLPQREQQRRRDGRVFTSYLPLFPGYVFARGGGAERLVALQSHRVVRTLEVRDQALLHHELESIWRLQQAGCPLIPHPYLGPGDEVEIVDGSFKGFRGTVIRAHGKLQLVVSVTLLRRAVATVFDRDVLAPAAPSSGARGRPLARATRR